MSLGYVGNPPSPTISSKDEKWEEMKKFRTYLLESGCPVGDHWFYTDLPSKMEFVTLKLRMLERKIDGLPLNVNIEIDGSPVYIKTLDNGYMQITYNKISEIVEAIEKRTKLIYTVMAQHKELMYMSNDFCNYNYKTGFPELYSGIAPPSPSN